MPSVRKGKITKFMVLLIKDHDMNVDGSETRANKDKEEFYFYFHSEA